VQAVPDRQLEEMWRTELEKLAVVAAAAATDGILAHVLPGMAAAAVIARVGDQPACARSGAHRRHRRDGRRAATARNPSD
jgi:hypothetical protein